MRGESKRHAPEQISASGFPIRGTPGHHCERLGSIAARAQLPVYAWKSLSKILTAMARGQERPSLNGKRSGGNGNALDDWNCPNDARHVGTMRVCHAR